MKYKAEPNSPTVGAPSARRVKLMPRGYKVYSSYKDSGVEWLGDIPDEWIVKRSKYVFNEINNRTATGEEDLLSVSEYYGVKPRSSVMSSGEHLSRAESLVDYKKCSKDNLVINIMLAWKRGLGVSKYDGIVSPAYCVFKAITPVEPYYMHDLFRTNLYTKRFKSKSTGVIDSRLRLYPEMFGTIETLLPPLQEQKSIANYLDKATTKIDTLIEKQTKLIALLKEKRQAVISSAVTRGLDASVPMKDSGVEWLGEIPEGWKVSKITHYGEVTKLTGFEYTNKWKTTANGEITALRGLNIKGRKLNLENTERISMKLSRELRRSKLFSGDVVFPCTGTIGSAALINSDDEFHINQNVAKITFNKTVFPMFGVYWMTSRFIKKTIDRNNMSGMQPVVLIGDIRKLPIPKLSLKEQEEIVFFLNKVTAKVDALIVKSSQIVDLLKEKRTALISAAVTGKIDVRDAA